MREHEEFRDILPAYIAAFENCEYRTYDVPESLGQILRLSAKVKSNQPKELSKVVNQAFTKEFEKWHEGRCSGSHAFPFHNDKGANIKNMGRLIDSRAILW